MALKDVTIVIIGIALLLAGIITMGFLFYVAFLALILFVLYDFSYLMLLRLELRQKLTVRTDTFGTEWNVLSNAAITTRIEYTGKKVQEFKIDRKVYGPLKVLSEPPEVLTLTPGQSYLLNMGLMPLSTGEVTIGPLNVTLESWLFSESISLGAAQTIKVSAGVGHSHNLVNPSRARVRMHTDLLRNATADTHGGTDFYNIRPYMVGDELKNIDWVRSSRTGALIVKEYEEARLLPVFFLLDLDTSMGVGERMTELDAAIATITRLVNKLLMDNTMYGLICFSRLDIVTFRPLSMGREHLGTFKAILSKVKPMERTDSSRIISTPFYQADNIGHILSKTEGFEVLGSVMQETLKEHVLNAKSDGFVRAVTRAAQSTNTSCQFIVITNLSMGIANLLNGIRIAEYYGHTVSIILTPHIWYQEREQIDVEKFYEKYLEIKRHISRIGSMSNVKIVDLYAGDRVDEIIYASASYGTRVGIRR
jgi:uncharacterized protein (DUF58 family)